MDKEAGKSLESGNVMFFPLIIFVTLTSGKHVPTPKASTRVSLMGEHWHTNSLISNLLLSK